MTKKHGYHHGDLRTALLKAAELELKTSGLEKFSLRGVARVASVSHAAPAHHFKDVTGLLTALAVVGWKRFLDYQIRYEKKANKDPLEQLIAAVMGYVEFARKNPELYQLIFASKKPDRSDEEFNQAGRDAFQHLVDLISAIAGQDAKTHPEHMVDVHATWALVHGLSGLLNSDFLNEINRNKKQRDEALRKIVLRYWDGR